MWAIVELLVGKSSSIPVMTFRGRRARTTRAVKFKREPPNMLLPLLGVFAVNELTRETEEALFTCSLLPVSRENRHQNLTNFFIRGIEIIFELNPYRVNFNFFNKFLFASFSDCNLLAVIATAI